MSTNVRVFGGLDTSDATATAAQIVSGYTAYGSAGTKLTGSFSGVDLSSLTDFELNLIGWLMCPSNTMIRASWSPDGNWDQSSVQSINFTITDGQGMYVTALGNINSSYLPGTYTMSKHPSTVGKRFDLNSMNYNNYSRFTLNSFTTTDGKVHTKANLNY